MADDQWLSSLMDSEEEALPKSKGGRPKGRLNNPTDGPQAALTRSANEVYEIIKHMLTKDERDYYQAAMTGRVEYDPVKHAEFFARLLGIYASKTVATMIIDDQRPSKEAAEIIGQFIKSTKDLEDVRRRREDVKAKNGNDEGVVDPTRESELGSVEKLLGKYTKDSKGKGS